MLVRALFVALTSVFLSAAGAIAQTGSPSPTAQVASPEPATYYASWGLIALGGLTVIMVLAAYLYHAPGFRQRSGRGAA